jgi:hypothetical protein
MHKHRKRTDAFYNGVYMQQCILYDGVYTPQTCVSIHNSFRLIG